MKTLTTITAAILLSGCASNDPTLADDVYRQGDGIYQSRKIADAIKQCDKENKTIEVITIEQTRDYKGIPMPMQIFRCVVKQ